MITLFATDGRTEMASVNDWQDAAENEGEMLSWECGNSGIYYVRVQPTTAVEFNADSGYKLSVYQPELGIPGLITGRVTDIYGNGLADVVIRTHDGPASTISYPAGYFIMAAPSGVLSLTAMKQPFETLIVNDIQVEAECTTHLDLIMTKSDLPLAHAGDDQRVVQGQTVTLDGSNSSVGTGDIVHWQWEQLSGPSVSLSDPAVANTYFIAPYSGQNNAVLDFQLTVTDNAGFSATDTCRVIVIGDDQTPVSDIKITPDIFDAPATIILDGSGSFDPDGGSLTYFWDVYGTGAFDLSDSSSAITDIAIQDCDYYVVQLTVTDADGLSSATTLPSPCSVMENCSLSGRIVEESGNGLDGVSIQFSELYDLIIQSEASGLFHVTVPKGVHQIELSKHGFLPKSISINAGGDEAWVETLMTRASNIDGPYAHAGEDMEVTEGNTVYLDGGGSIGQPQNALNYRWEQIAGPAVSLINPNAAITKFVTPIISSDSETVILQLTVTDDFGFASSDEVVIAIQDNDIDAYPESTLSFRSATNHPMAIEVVEGAELAELACIPSTDIADTRNRPRNMIYGVQLLQFQTVEGDKASFVLYLPDMGWYGDRPYEFYQHHPEIGWKKVPETEASSERKKITFTLSDGGPVDEDGKVNGLIQLTGAIGIQYATDESQDSSSGGCFIDTIRNQN